MTKRKGALALGAAIALLGTMTVNAAAAQSWRAYRGANAARYHRTALTAGERMFMRTVAQANAGEVLAGRLAAQRASSPEVKMMGRQMVQDHSAAGRQLRQVAASHRIALPAAPDRHDRAVLARLSRLRGAAFDRAYVQAERRDHAQTVRLFERETQRVQDPLLKTFVLENLPVVQRHLEHFQRVQPGR